MGPDRAQNIPRVKPNWVPTDRTSEGFGTRKPGRWGRVWATLPEARRPDPDPATGLPASRLFRGWVGWGIGSVLLGDVRGPIWAQVNQIKNIQILGEWDGANSLNIPSS